LLLLLLLLPILVQLLLHLCIVPLSSSLSSSSSRHSRVLSVWRRVGGGRVPAVATVVQPQSASSPLLRSHLHLDTAHLDAVHSHRETIGRGRRSGEGGGIEGLIHVNLAVLPLLASACCSSELCSSCSSRGSALLLALAHLGRHRLGCSPVELRAAATDATRCLLITGRRGHDKGGRRAAREQRQPQRADEGRGAGARLRVHHRLLRGQIGQSWGEQGDEPPRLLHRRQWRVLVRPPHLLLDQRRCSSCSDVGCRRAAPGALLHIGCRATLARRRHRRRLEARVVGRRRWQLRPGCSSCSGGGCSCCVMRGERLLLGGRSCSSILLLLSECSSPLLLQLLHLFLLLLGTLHHLHLLLLLRSRVLLLLLL
ncbi:hypothetical protein PFISCL1PPCAC_8810, partial [Pristionchus fissidentatus]